MVAVASQLLPLVQKVGSILVPPGARGREPAGSLLRLRLRLLPEGTETATLWKPEPVVRLPGTTTKDHPRGTNARPVNFMGRGYYSRRHT